MGRKKNNLLEEELNLGTWDRVCATCGKEFNIYGYSNYAWKTPALNKWFCSYTCARESDKVEESKRRSKLKYGGEDYEE